MKKRRVLHRAFHSQVKVDSPESAEPAKQCGNRYGPRKKWSANASLTQVLANKNEL